MAISWSPDGRWLSYTDSGKGTLGDCYLVSTFDGVVSKATGLLHPDFNVDATRPPVWDAMGKALYFIVSYSELWRITIASGSVQRLAVIPGHKMLEIVAPFPRGRFRTDHDGRTLTVATLNDATKESGFYRIDLVTGEHQRVVEENKAYGPNQYLNTVSPALGNLFAFVAQDSEHPPDYWILERDKTTPQRLTHINPEIDRYALGRSKLIEWNSIDGQRLHGVLLLPPGYKPGNTYPMVVWVYGGAELSGNANVFGGSQIEFGAIDNMQLLASRGYAVLFPDAPLGIGSPLRDLACTVLPGVDKAIELGVADPDRIGVMGESLGGYSTLALIVQTPRFKAAIMRAGWGNQVSAYGAMGEDGSSFTLGILENGTGRMGGTPWQYRDRYIENSPVFYLDRVETPLFIVHGSNDTNVLPFLAGEVYIGLQRLGKEVVYAKYAGEGHDISMYANQVDYCNRMIAWFDEHLKNAGFEQKPSEANGSAVIRERQKTQSY